MEDEEQRRTGYCDGSLVRAKVFSFGRSVPERAEPRGSEQRTRTRGKSVEWMVQAATHQWDAKARASALAIVARSQCFLLLFFSLFVARSQYFLLLFSFDCGPVAVLFAAFLFGCVFVFFTFFFPFFLMCVVAFLICPGAGAAQPVRKCIEKKIRFHEKRIVQRYI
jgi:hypothetical protein